jgi:hypothetical protein
LYDLGHTIVGVEYVQKALDEFFAEHNIAHTVEDVALLDGKVYKV